MPLSRCCIMTCVAGALLGAAELVPSRIRRRRRIRRRGRGDGLPGFRKRRGGLVPTCRGTPPLFSLAGGQPGGGAHRPTLEVDPRVPATEAAVVDLGVELIPSMGRPGRGAPAGVVCRTFCTLPCGEQTGVNPTGPDSGEARIMRGGGCSRDAGGYRSVARSGRDPTDLTFAGHIGLGHARGAPWASSSGAGEEWSVPSGEPEGERDGVAQDLPGSSECVGTG